MATSEPEISRLRCFKHSMMTGRKATSTEPIDQTSRDQATLRSRRWFHEGSFPARPRRLCLRRALHRCGRGRIRVHRFRSPIPRRASAVALASALGRTSGVFPSRGHDADDRWATSTPAAANTAEVTDVDAVANASASRITFDRGARRVERTGVSAADDESAIVARVNSGDAVHRWDRGASWGRVIVGRPGA
jgi:hypothetical protein